MRKVYIITHECSDTPAKVVAGTQEYLAARNYVDSLIKEHMTPEMVEEGYTVNVMSDAAYDDNYVESISNPNMVEVDTWTITEVSLLDTPTWRPTRFGRLLLSILGARK